MKINPSDVYLLALCCVQGTRLQNRSLTGIAFSGFVVSVTLSSACVLLLTLLPKSSCIQIMNFVTAFILTTRSRLELLLLAGTARQEDGRQCSNSFEGAALLERFSAACDSVSVPVATFKIPSCVPALLPQTNFLDLLCGAYYVRFAAAKLCVEVMDFLQICKAFQRCGGERVCLRQLTGAAHSTGRCKILTPKLKCLHCSKLGV